MVQLLKASCWHLNAWFDEWEARQKLEGMSIRGGAESPDWDWRRKLSLGV